MQSLVERIGSELAKLHERGEKNNIIINRCWNIIRVISENKEFMPVYYNNIEGALKPLFEYMADPS